MNPVDLIIKKRNGNKLSQQEIEAFIEGVSDDSWADYQVSAMLMALFIKGMDEQETAAMTMAMAHSGHQLNLDAVAGTKVDKHSTGGVADTTTLILVPLIAACGVPIIKMSGRGLGFTGGTIDKLESIPGFETNLSETQVIRQANDIQMAILSQTDNLTPADRKLYALRDVTGTIDSIPLIAASIMSKKIAAGTDAIVLDVKCGSGAFMQNEQDARALAASMTAIGHQVGRKVKAVISRMDQPLGNYVGNSLEVIETIEVLKGNMAGDLLDVTLTLGSQLLCLADRCKTPQEARQLLLSKIKNGEGLRCLSKLITAQKGDPGVLDDYQLFPQAKVRRTLTAQTSGFLTNMQTAEIGQAFIETGGGRKKKNDAIDLAAGFIFHKRLGDHIKEGEALLDIFTQSEQQASIAENILRQAIRITHEPAEILPVMIDLI